MMNNNITNHFIKRLTGILLILCLSFGVLAGCGKGKKPDENSDHAEAADSTASDTDTEPADADEVKDSREEQAENISGIEVLHSVISSKGIRVARPGDSASCSDVEWDTVCLSDEDAAKYPQLAKALAAYSQEQDEAAELFSNDGKNQALDYLDGIKEELAENGQLTDDWYYDLTEWPYYIDFEYRSLLNIIRCDEIAFTLQEDYYDYEGGTHGYYACSGTNFDTQTGQKLKVEDVVKDMDKLNDILYDKLMTKYEDLELDEGMVREDLRSKASGEYYEHAWLLGYDRVTFYFNPYAIAAYADGMQVIDIFFAEYPELFEEKYTKAPDEYVLHFRKEGETTLDLDGDGKVEKISAKVIEKYEYYPEETDIGRSTVSITIDEETDHYSMPEGYGGDLYFVHAKCGNYIYFQTKVYDFSRLMCIDISDGYARRVHRLMGFEPYIIDMKWDGTDLEYGMNESSTETITEAFTSPSCFALSAGVRRTMYHVGLDGMPEGENAGNEALAGEKAQTAAGNTDFAGTYWCGAYLEQFDADLPDEERFSDYAGSGSAIDLFIYKDGTALLRSIRDNAYEAYACKGKWKEDGRGGILLTDCTDPDGDERNYYDACLTPHLYPADVEVRGEKGLLAMEFYDKCLYFRQEAMPDARNDLYAGIDLSNPKKVKKAMETDNLSGEWVLSSIRTGNKWISGNETDAVCTISLWDKYADFYYYSEQEGVSEQFYGMRLTYEKKSISDENSNEYTLYAYPIEGTYEDRYSYLCFQIAPYGESLMVQRLAESRDGGSASVILYYFFRPEY